MNLSFVYPVYNEIENLPHLLPGTRRIARGLITDYEVILVDDGSTDGSGAFMDGLAATCPNLRVLHHERNRGLGAAIRTGLAHATKDLVLYMDSDFPVSVEEARAAIGQLSSDTDLLIGYRLGRAEGPRREIMSWTYNRLIRSAFGLGVRDVNFAFKLIRRPLLERMRLRSEGSFIDAEILIEAQRLGARIREVGLRYHTRVAGESTAASGRVVLRILGEAWRYRRRSRAIPGPTRVIITADDLGLCEPVNRGIAAAFDRGVVTGASIMPTGDDFAAAADMARALPELDLGVHLALTQTKPVSSPELVPSLVDQEGLFPRGWRSLLARYLRGAIRKQDVARELRAQIERTRASGLSVSYLDGHQHLHMLPGILPIVVQLAREFGIGAIRYPLQRRGRTGGGSPAAGLRRRVEKAGLGAACRLGARLVRTNGLLVVDDFRGFSEAGGWDAEALVSTLMEIAGGTTEICCHPGADDGIADRYPWGYRWEQELAALTSPQVASALSESGAALTTYRDCLARAGR